MKRFDHAFAGDLLTDILQGTARQAARKANEAKKAKGITLKAGRRPNGTLV